MLFELISAFHKVGGFQGLWDSYPHAVTNEIVPNTTCHLTNQKWDIMLKHVDDPDMPWLGFLLGQTPSSIWYWCADQVSVNE